MAPPKLRPASSNRAKPSSGFLARPRAIPDTRSRFLHAPLVLQVPRKIGEQDRIALFGEFKDAAIVVLAGLRPVGLGQNHAHQVVRLWVLCAMRTAVRAWCSASARLPLPSTISATSVVPPGCWDQARQFDGAQRLSRSMLPWALRICRGSTVPLVDRGRVPRHQGIGVPRSRPHLGGAPGSRSHQWHYGRSLPAAIGDPRCGVRHCAARQPVAGT